MTDISSIDNYDDAITYIESSDFTALDSATKVSQIEQLVNQLPTAAEGQTVLGYSGTINIQGSDPLFSYQIAEPVGAESGGAIATFDQTEAAMFLKSASVQTTLEGIQTESDLDTFNATMTSEISANLAASTTGPVKTITGFMEGTFSDQTGGVSVSSDYFQRELPDWLNSAAPTINGIPRQTLVDAFESQAGHSISTIDLTNPTDVNALIAVQNNYIAPKSINDVMMGLEIPVDSSGNPVIDDDTGKLQSVGVGDTYITDVAGGVTHDLDPALTGSQVGSVIDLSNGEIAALADGSEALSAAGVSAPVLDLVQASSSAHTDVASGDLSSAGHDLAQILGEIENGGTPAGETETGDLAGRLALLVGEGASETLGAVLGAASGLTAVAGLADLEISIGENLGLIDPASMSTLVTNYSWALTNPSDVLKEAGMEIGDAFHSISSAVSSAFSLFGDGESQASPLVIDLSSGHTGITLTEFNAATTATFYDIEGTGFAQQTAWTSGSTGFLVHENTDGTISLFGSTTVDGFAKLAELNSNGDLKIDSHDSAWSSLAVWVDSNGNGVVDSGELQTLASVGIASIDLASVAPSTDVIDGNPISHTSTVTFTDGSTSEIGDAWFVHSTVNTIYDGSYNLDLGTLFLPDLRGYGTVPDLDIAMSQDSTLKSMVSDYTTGFAASGFSSSTLDSDAANILYEWAGVESVDPSSRGPNVNAQQLEFLEHLFGQNFVSTFAGGANPTQTPGASLEASWDMVSNAFEAQLLLQAGGSSLFANPVTYNPWTGTVDGDLGLSQSGISALDDNAPAPGSSNLAYWENVAHFIDSIKGLDNLTTDESSWLNSAVNTSDSSLTWTDVLNAISTAGTPGGEIEGTAGNDTITGTSGDDTILGLGGNDIINAGDGNDIVTLGTSGVSTVHGGFGNDTITASVGDNTLYGDAGNDTINGGSGNDTIYGGTGGNIIHGGAGTNTYVFGGGDDVIYSGGSADQILLPSGIVLGDLTFTRLSSEGSTTQFNDLLITVADGGGTMQIVDHFLGSSYEVGTLVFSDSSTLDLTTITDYTTVLTNGDDEYSPGLNIDQTVYGQDGNDVIVTGSGNDTLDGGNGNDILEGGGGNDTYIASPGFDAIEENGVGGTDTIVVPTGYSLSDVTFSRHIGTHGPDDDLIIDIRGLGEIRVQDQFYSSAYAVENLYFTDGGTTVSLADQTIQTIGTSGDDSLSGLTSGVAGNWFDGRGGNDYFTGGIGDNTFVLEAGFGNDTISIPYHTGNTNTLSFEGVDPSNIRMWTNVYGDVFLQDSTNASHTLEILAGTTGSGYAENAIGSYLEQIKFDDGTTWDLTSGLTLTADNSGDYLYGSASGDILIGGTGNDNLYGNGGDDTLVGGGGADNLSGGAGNDTYIIASGFGNTTITDNSSAGSNVIHLSGIDPADVRLWTDNYGTLHLQDTTNPSYSITVAAGKTGSGTDESTIGTYFSEITFDPSYSTTWDLTGGLHITGDNSGDYLYGTAYGDTITGGTGNDVIYGNGGDDTIISGGGTDNLSGGDGNDTYVLASGFGNTTITDNSSAGSNVIHLSGIDPADIRLWTDNYGTLHLQDTTNPSYSITVAAGTTGSGTHESTIGTYFSEVTFDSAYSTTWNLTSGLHITGDNSGDYLYGTAYGDTITGGTGSDQIYGNGGDDTIISGGGADNLSGGAGNDTYVFASGFGNSTVTDNADGSASNTIHFTGIDPADIRMWTDNYGALHLQDTTNPSYNITVSAGTTGSGTHESTIGSYFSEVTFDSGYGTTIDLTGGLPITGDNSGDYLYGTAYGDTITGGTGSDQIYGNGGNDIIYGGGGADYLSGGAGADTFLFKAATAETGVATIADFSTSDGDKLDIANVISDYDPLTMLIGNFVELTTSGGSTQVKVDTDGSGTSYTQIATLSGVTGLNLNDLITDGNLIVHHT